MRVPDCAVRQEHDPCKIFEASRGEGWGAEDVSSGVGAPQADRGQSEHLWASVSVKVVGVLCFPWRMLVGESMLGDTR